MFHQLAGRIDGFLVLVEEVVAHGFHVEELRTVGGVVISWEIFLGHLNEFEGAVGIGPHLAGVECHVNQEVGVGGVLFVHFGEIFLGPVEVACVVFGFGALQLRGEPFAVDLGLDHYDGQECYQ